MTVATAINLALVLLCLGVLVQSIRMDRRIRALRQTGLDEAVAQLDRATEHARVVLGELKQVLSSGAAQQGGELAVARELRDELSLMVGIGNALADRIVDVSEQARTVEAAARRRQSRNLAEEAPPKADTLRTDMDRVAPPPAEDLDRSDIGRAADEAAARLRARAAALRDNGSVFDIGTVRGPRGSAVA